jgi:hypothetical protein
LEKYSASIFKVKEEGNQVTSEKIAEIIPDYMASHPT